MPYKPQSRCPVCLNLHSDTGTCNTCTLRGKRGRRPYTSAEQTRRAETVQAWRAQYGDLCPGWQRDPHWADKDNPLTADHIDAVGAGGAEAGPLTVLCRSCNSIKGASTSPT